MSVSLAPLLAESERVLAKAVDHFGLKLCPERIVVTIQAAGKTKAYGWFWASRWQNGQPNALHEINLSAEHLKACDVGEVLLHELAHAENKHLGIQDCSGQRHNRRFKAMAERLGLTVEDPAGHTVGYGVTHLGSEGSKFLEGITFKRELFAMCRVPDPEAVKAPLPGSRLVKVVCPVCGYVIRTTRKWLGFGVPTCRCGQEMAAPAEESGETVQNEPAAAAAEEKPDEHWLVTAWDEVDAKVAAAIGAGEIGKASSLQILQCVREAVRKRQPDLAARLVLPLTTAQAHEDL